MLPHFFSKEKKTHFRSSRDLCAPTASAFSTPSAAAKPTQVSDEQGIISRTFTASRDFLLPHIPRQVVGPSAVFSRSIDLAVSAQRSIDLTSSQDFNMWGIQFVKNEFEKKQKAEADGLERLDSLMNEIDDFVNESSFDLFEVRQNEELMKKTKGKNRDLAQRLMVIDLVVNALHGTRIRHTILINGDQTLLVELQKYYNQMAFCVVGETNIQGGENVMLTGMASVTEEFLRQFTKKQVAVVGMNLKRNMIDKLLKTIEDTPIQPYAYVLLPAEVEVTSFSRLYGKEHLKRDFNMTSQIFAAFPKIASGRNVKVFTELANEMLLAHERYPRYCNYATAVVHYGRVRALQALQYTVNVIRFADIEVDENCVIVATRSNQ